MSEFNNNVASPLKETLREHFEKWNPEILSDGTKAAEVEEELEILDLEEQKENGVLKSASYR